jgi:hypothetical protein
MDNATGWGSFRTNFSAGDVFLGTSTLYLLGTSNETNSNGSGVAQGDAMSIAAGTYTLSCVAKAGPTDPGLLNMRPTENSDFANRAEAWFNLETGVAGTVSFLGTNFTAATSKIEDLGGGEYRCSLTFTTDATLDMRPRFYIVDADGGLTATIGKDLQLCGAQMEEYHVATSLIITGASSEARAKDEASCVIADKIPGFIQGSGSLVFEGSMDYETGGSGFPRLIQIDDGDNFDRVSIFAAEASGVYVNRYAITSDTAQAVLSSAAIASGISFKAVARYSANDFAASYSGAAAVADTSGSVPTLTTVRLGDLNGVTRPIRVSHFSIGPYASPVASPGWSNAQLALISGP